MKTRREIVYEASKGYKKLSKKEKTERLDNLVAITGYNRDHASRLLSQHDRCVYVKDVSGRSYRLVGDVRKKEKRSRKSKYDTEVFKALKQIWAIMDYPCGKQLISAKIRGIWRDKNRARGEGETINYFCFHYSLLT